MNDPEKTEWLNAVKDLAQRAAMHGGEWRRDGNNIRRTLTDSSGWQWEVAVCRMNPIANTDAMDTLAEYLGAMSPETVLKLVSMIQDNDQGDGRREKTPPRQ